MSAPGKEFQSGLELDTFGRKGGENKNLKTADGEPDQRDEWPSRTAFILAGMGSAIGVGNLLRYPSIAFANYGAQWFIPYLTGLVFIGIPLMIFEITIGEAYQGGAVLALGRIHPRMRGIGMGAVYMAFVKVTYYNVIMAWVWGYFRRCFISPLPWGVEAKKFFEEEVVQNISPLDSDDDGTYGMAMVWETYGWSIVMWVLVFFCIFKGVHMTGKIVYVTMCIPLVMLCIITIRGVTLPSAWNGIRLYIASFRPDLLAHGKIWAQAVIQIFFSVALGNGIYVAYASYNNKHQNAVQDAIIIMCANSSFEMLAGFAAFGIIGFLNLPLDSHLSTFSLGFFTYPAVLAQLPGANFAAFTFFFTLLLLGVDSSFALAEAFITAIVDSRLSSRFPRWVVCLAVCVVGALLGALYSTKIGMAVMNAVDLYINELSLFTVTWCQCVSINILYRWQDVFLQCGKRAFLVFNAAYIGGQIIGCLAGQLLGFTAGLIVGLVVGISGLTAAVLLSKDPKIIGPFGRNRYANRFWWLSSYSGNQLRRDLNAVVAAGGKTRIPIIWAPLLKWFTAPALMVLLSLVFPKIYHNVGKDKINAFGLALAGIGALVCVIGFIWERFSLPFLPEGEAHKWKEQYAPGPYKTVKNPAFSPHPKSP